MPMIRRIAYVSRPRAGMSLSELPRIVSACRAHNEIDHITGVLLFTGLDFAQLIEGAPQPVERLWARLLGDDRHEGILRLLDTRAESRRFADWRVGFPTEGALQDRIAQWRAQGPRGSCADSDELLRLFAEADAL